MPAAGEDFGVRENRGHGVMYAPVVRFTTQLGQTVELADEILSSPPGYRVGDRVRVLYDRHDPSDVRLAPTFKLYVSEVIFAAVVAFFAVVGCVLVFASAFRQGRALAITDDGAECRNPHLTVSLIQSPDCNQAE